MHWQTHTVFNQPTPLNNSNLFLSDTALREAVVREGPSHRSLCGPSRSAGDALKGRGLGVYR